MCRKILLWERDNPRNFACFWSWIFFMFAMFFLSKMSLEEDVLFVAAGSGRPAAFWRSLFRSCIGVAVVVPGIFCSLQAFIASAFFIASILAYCSFSASVMWVILLSYL